MKSNIILFSTRDIGNEKTIFENKNSQYICNSMCKYFIQVNKKELIEAKKKHIPSSVNAELPTKEKIKEIIKEGNMGVLPSDISRIYEKSDSNNLIEKALELFRRLPENEVRKNTIDILQSYVSREVLFDITDFENNDIKNEKAVNLDKKDRTIEERISIYKTADETCKVKDGEIEKDILFQILAVWSLSKPDNDKIDAKYSVSWLDTLVHSVIELVKKQNIELVKKQNEAINEIEMYLFLHDKDLESICNIPFKTMDTKTNNYEGINITYTLISFTHADKEYNQIKNSANLNLPKLYEIVKQLTNDSVVFQNLLELSDIIAQWEDKDKRKEFINKIKELKNLVGEKEWITTGWAALKKDSDSLMKIIDEDESCGSLLLNVNYDINSLIKTII